MISDLLDTLKLKEFPDPRSDPTEQYATILKYNNRPPAGRRFDEIQPTAPQGKVKKPSEELISLRKRRQQPQAARTEEYYWRKHSCKPGFVERIHDRFSALLIEKLIVYGGKGAPQTIADEV